MANKKMGKNFTSDNSKEIVGWFTRGGKRIPIYKKKGDTIKGVSKEEAHARMEAVKREERKEAWKQKSEENRGKSIRELENPEGKDSFGMGEGKKSKDPSISKMLPSLEKELEKNGFASVPFESFSGTGMDFVKEMRALGYNVEYDVDSDEHYVWRGNNRPAFLKGRYKRRNGNKIYY